MDRLFLDANILFSAAHSRWSLMRQLWELEDVELVSAVYTVAEARRNLAEKKPECLPLFDGLVDKLDLVYGFDVERIASAQLPEKDAPVLAAAVVARATHLLTGDKAHFGHLLGTRIDGVLILSPGEYLRQREYSIDEPRRS